MGSFDEIEEIFDSELKICSLNKFVKALSWATWSFCRCGKAGDDEEIGASDDEGKECKASLVFVLITRNFFFLFFEPSFLPEPRCRDLPAHCPKLDSNACPLPPPSSTLTFYRIQFALLYPTLPMQW